VDSWKGVKEAKVVMTYTTVEAPEKLTPQDPIFSFYLRGFTPLLQIFHSFYYIGNIFGGEKHT
jgi:hypothetical protein